MPSDEASHALIQRLGAQARKSPRTYKVKLALLAVLGYVTLTLVPLTPLLIGGTVVALVMASKAAALNLLKFWLLPFVLISWIAFVLRTRFILPPGYRLKSGEAPLLVAEIESVRRATGAPALSGIIIHAHLNAAAVCVPRLMGLLGSRHYLVVGLPLMNLLDRRQFASAVAHEFGHIGGGHHRFGAWICLLRQIWPEFLEIMQHQRSMTTLLFKRFFTWYSPYFNAYSFVLARQNEIEADAIAARISGNQAAAQAVVKLELGRRYLSRVFWPEVNCSHFTRSDPPRAIYSELAKVLRNPLPDRAELLEGALGQSTGMDDTHPSLAERLATWGVKAEIPTQSGLTAADELLGSWQTQLEARFSEEWLDSANILWHKNHQKAALRRAHLDKLDALRRERPLEGNEAVAYAGLVHDLRKDQDAAPLYEDSLRILPNNVAANYRYGELLLARKSSTGIGHVEKAMQYEEKLAEHGLKLLLDYYETANDPTIVASIRNRLKLCIARKAATLRERKHVTRQDVFVPCDLDSATLARLVQRVNGIGGIKKIWIVRKQIPDGGDVPHYVLLVEWRGMTFSNTSRIHRLADAFELPGTIHVITENAGRVIHKLRKVARKPVYARGLFSQKSQLA